MRLNTQMACAMQKVSYVDFLFSAWHRKDTALHPHSLLMCYLLIGLIKNTLGC